MVIELPTVTIIIPQLGRPEGLQRCLQSIYALNYPQERINTLVLADEGEKTVPQKIKQGVELSSGEWICYAANDMEFETDSLKIAVTAGIENGKSLVSFNEGELLPDKGNICTHFVIKRSFIPSLENGEIFSCDFIHAGCDNWLHAQAEKMNEFMYCEDAKIIHRHFSRGTEYDWVYKKAYENRARDVETLQKKLSSL